MEATRFHFETERPRFVDEADLREQERQERMAHEYEIRTQLGDLTNLVQDSHSMMEERKVVNDARYEEKQARQLDKEAQMIELRDMFQKMHDDMEGDRARYEDDKRNNKQVLEGIIDVLHRQYAEQQELLQSLSESKQP